MRAVGYRQLWAHLDGRYGLEEAVMRAIAATRQLAKRQLTWMRAEARGTWLDLSSEAAWRELICHKLAAAGVLSTGTC